MAKYKSRVKALRLIVKVTFPSDEKINERELDFFSSKVKNVKGLLKPKLVRRFRRTCLEYTGVKGVSLFKRLKEPLTAHDFLFIIEEIVDITQKLKSNSLL